MCIVDSFGSLTWEQIGISRLHTSIVRSGEGAAHAVVNRAVRTVASGDHESISGSCQTRRTLCGHVRADVHAVFSSCGCGRNGRCAPYTALKIARAGAISRIRSTSAKGSLEASAAAIRGGAPIASAAFNVGRSGTQAGSYFSGATSTRNAETDTFYVVNGARPLIGTGLSVGISGLKSVGNWQIFRFFTVANRKCTNKQQGNKRGAKHNVEWSIFFWKARKI